MKMKARRRSCRRASVGTDADVTEGPAEELLEALLLVVVVPPHVCLVSSKAMLATGHRRLRDIVGKDGLRAYAVDGDSVMRQ